MAGSVSIARVPRDKGVLREAFITLTLTCVTDSSAGTLPDTTLGNLGGYKLVEVQPIPGATPITTVFALVMDDADGAEVFDSGQVELTDNQPISGEGGSPASHYPRLSEGMVLRWVDPTDHSTDADMDNSKNLTLVLRLEL